MEKLTERQQEVLDFLKQYHADNGYYAGKSDLQRKYEFSYPTAQYFIKLLMRKGHLEQINRGVYRPVQHKNNNNH